MTQSVLELLRADTAWRPAVERLHALNKMSGTTAERAAAEYAAVYDGARGAMIVDVVASRRRTYTTRVKRTVERWKDANAEHTIAWLASNRLDAKTYGLSVDEVGTIAKVASNLADFAQVEGLTDEDVACRAWADRAGSVEHAPTLDPIVGSVKGIGLALFAYMRMRSGADAIKVDVRVKRSLRRLGFNLPGDDHATMIVAKAASEEIGVSALVLDQLLWSMD